MSRSLSPFLPVLVVVTVVLSSCSSQGTGGAYGEAEEVGGAYSEPVMAEEMPAGAYGSYASSPVPAATSTERYPEASTNPVQAVVDQPVSTFSIDVDTASYANVRRFLEDGRMPPRDAVRTEELINYFDYDYRLPSSRAVPFEAAVAVVPSPWKEGNRLLHIGLQGYDIESAARPDLNLVLLIDVSGSMAEADRLPLVQKALGLLVSELGPRDRVSIVVYANAAGPVLDSARGDEKKRILHAIDNLSAGGSTAGGQGIELAYRLAEKNFRKGAVNRVVLATDGDFNVGVSSPVVLEQLISEKRKSGVYLSVIGVGRGNYQDLTMQKLAQAGNGNASYLDSLAEARKVLRDEMRASMLPIADDVKIQVEFNPARIAEYRLIGYETRMLRREDFSNDRIDAGEIGAGANVTAIYEVVPVGGKTTVEPLRYAKPDAEAGESAGPASKELAFLRIRYKRPGAKESKLIERPITDRDGFDSIERAPESTRFATAVAAYGQLLRDEPYLDSSYGWKPVIELANGARGRDEDGWRAEFVNLVRQAEMIAPARIPAR